MITRFFIFLKHVHRLSILEPSIKSMSSSLILGDLSELSSLACSYSPPTMNSLSNTTSPSIFTRRTLWSPIRTFGASSSWALSRCLSASCRRGDGCAWRSRRSCAKRWGSSSIYPSFSAASFSSNDPFWSSSSTDSSRRCISPESSPWSRHAEWGSTSTSAVASKGRQRSLQ